MDYLRPGRRIDWLRDWCDSTVSNVRSFFRPPANNHRNDVQDQTCPAVKCVLSRISASYRARSISCEAFDIQVRRLEVDKVVGLACTLSRRKDPKDTATTLTTQIALLQH
jgi:hypothetical protein